MSRDWTEMDNRELDAPRGWDWTIGDTLAHHIWQLTEVTRELGWGPDPPILLEQLMGHFPDRSMTDSLNNTYLTRIPGEQYADDHEWYLIGNQFDTPGDQLSTSRKAYSPEQDPHPLRSKLHSQQYTTTGAMFTYEFSQWQGEEPSGMMRIPVADEIRGVARRHVEELPFEEFEVQSRTYQSQFADGPTPGGTYLHPHYRPAGNPDLQDYKDLFDVAVNIMKRSVRLES